MRPRVVVFTRPPTPGRVKTRLIPALGASGAARLHEAMALDTLALCRRVLGPSADLVVALDGDPEHPWARGLGLPVLRQEGADLGERMARAPGEGPALVLGTDLPTLPAELLAEAARLPAELVLGPALDGGYWAIGWRRPHPAVLQGIPWSTGEVLARTLDKARALGLSPHLLAPWTDVDTPADLDALRRQLADLPPSVAPRTRAALHALSGAS